MATEAFKALVREAQELITRFKYGMSAPGDGARLRDCVSRCLRTSMTSPILRPNLFVVIGDLSYYLAADGCLDVVENALGQLVCQDPTLFEVQRTVYEGILESCGAAAAPGDAVAMAERIAQLEPRSPARWAAVATAAYRASTALAGRRRWAEHAQVVKTFRRIPFNTYSLFSAWHWAAALSDWIGRALEADRPRDVIVALQDFHSMEDHLADERVRRELAVSLGQALRYFSKRKARKGRAFRTILDSFARLVIVYPGDRHTARSFAAAAPLVERRLLANQDDTRLFFTLKTLHRILRKHEGDEELASSVARGLVDAARMRLDQVRKGLGGATTGQDGVLKALWQIMVVAARSCPRSRYLAEARERFERTTGLSFTASVA